MRLIDLTGQKFGRLKVVKRVEDHITSGGNKKAQWLCVCDCGNETVVTGENLRRGTTLSCGCLQRERASEAYLKYNIDRRKKKANYEFRDNVVFGVTTDGKRFAFDEEDFDKISRYTWRTHHGYVVASSIEEGMVFMHRLIMDVPAGMETDHINHNRLDNRKVNLRVVSCEENSFNRGPRSTNKSGYVGVYPVGRNGSKWAAEIRVKRKRIRLGRFAKREDAIAARLAAEERYYGRYSYSNSLAIAEKNGYVLES